MHNKVDLGFDVNLYFRYPNCTLDITITYLKCDQDVKLWAKIWDPLPHLEVFVEKIDQTSRLTSKEQPGNKDQLTVVEQTSNQQQAITKGKRTKRTTTKAKGKMMKQKQQKRVTMMNLQQSRVTMVKPQAMLCSRLKRKNLNG
ncbi:hypothetical protein ACH5RR_023109 [Cinchona calisaya]|uniref:Uncharacterized protein n=1 Tax=Cinchona calisaya TaxID=153742 RepID=A0ABD2Z9Q8_9GENT